jgi:uncharacterized protein (DUF2147 family)
MSWIKRYGFLIISLLVFIFLFTGGALAINLSPKGYWAVRNERTGHVTGVVQIWQQHGKYYGKVVKIYSVDGNKPTDLCKKCPGSYHNKPILGMLVLSGFINYGTYYGKGAILDPKNGEVYHARLTLLNQGMKLGVRGYVGNPLFGRTQTWTRVPNPNQTTIQKNSTKLKLPNRSEH